MATVAPTGGDAWAGTSMTRAGPTPAVGSPSGGPGTAAAEADGDGGEPPIVDEHLLAGVGRIARHSRTRRPRVGVAGRYREAPAHGPPGGDRLP